MKDRPRRPAFRTKPPKTYQKPLFFVKDKWERFQRLSTRQKIAIVGGTTFAAMVLIPLVSYLYFVRDISNRERLMNRNNTGIVITDRNDELVYSFGKTATERLYTLDEISDDMEKAVIAAEDKNFYEHSGFSFRSMIGALIGNILNMDITRYGGSTLTQQLVKNNLLTSNKNFLRKYQELSIAIAIERHYTKDEILEMYLNSVYLGEGAFGIEQAAKTYFNKSPEELTLTESSVLAGLLPAPSRYSPLSGDIGELRSQQNRVLTQMVSAGYINEEELEVAMALELSYAEASPITQQHAHHFTRMVIEELNERYGEEKVTRSGFRVKSSLDLNSQKQAEKTVAEQTAQRRNLGATNASLVAIDPKTGEIKALAGSVDWNNEEFGQVNMAITPRQPGSSFKPVYYSEAFDKRLITAATIIRDEPKVYGANYRPENYDFRHRGDITVRNALATSLNIPAIEVLQKLGVEEGSEAARRMGISTVTEPEKYGLSLALGTAETRLLDMTNAYAAFANQGSQFKPTGVISIEDKFGKTIFTNGPRAERVQSPEASYLISSILSDNAARAPTFGNNLTIWGRDVAVKTGTTNDNKDAWTIGYTPSLAVGVWVGDNKNAPMQIGGSAAAGPIWRTTMQQMLGNSRAEQFPRPGRIIEVRVCNISGNYLEYFIRGTAPQSCAEPQQQDDEAARRAEEERKKQEEEERRRREAEQEEPDEDDEDPEEEDEDEDPEETPPIIPPEQGEPPTTPPDNP